MKSLAPTVPDLHHVSKLAVFGLVLWLGCLMVGVLGLLVPYGRPQPKAISIPVQAQTLDVVLSHPPPARQSPPPAMVVPPETPVTPDIPPPQPVAEPSPAIAFALPVAAPVRMVNRQSVAPVATAPAAPTPQVLTFGEGEGRQPAPEYPTRAQNEGQQGDVTIRFTVAADGRVVAAAVAVPSPWKLLDDSALQTVRERWKFSAGAVRIYDVVIHFVLN